MQTAFYFMLATCSLAAIATVATDLSFLRATAWIGALGATILWLAHVTAFALRFVERKADAPRRRFLTFLGAAAFAISATSFPIGAVAATCTCARNLKCCWNYDQTYATCAARSHHCCAHKTSPWSCPSNQTCNGDGNKPPRCR